ncbi:matrix protein [Tahe rhabdovirus 2]|nr:matrix protein [Tahe rhabdovirus 2]UXX19012.1 matrix protein [Tahe rhabdovirus 2]
MKRFRSLFSKSPRPTGSAFDGFAQTLSLEESEASPSTSVGEPALILRKTSYSISGVLTIRTNKPVEDRKTFALVGMNLPMEYRGVLSLRHLDLTLTLIMLERINSGKKEGGEYVYEGTFDDVIEFFHRPLYDLPRAPRFYTDTFQWSYRGTQFTWNMRIQYHPSRIPGITVPEAGSGALCDLMEAYGIRGVYHADQKKFEILPM